MIARVLCIALAALTVSPAMAARTCAPIDNSARILASANPNDLHKDWRGENTIGLSWSFALKDTVTVDGISYARGDLISPRGGVVNRNIYILLREWDCQ